MQTLGFWVKRINTNFSVMLLHCLNKNSYLFFLRATQSTKNTRSQETFSRSMNPNMLEIFISIWNSFFSSSCSNSNRFSLFHFFLIPLSRFVHVPLNRLIYHWLVFLLQTWHSLFWAFFRFNPFLWFVFAARRRPLNATVIFKTDSERVGRTKH